MRNVKIYRSMGKTFRSYKSFDSDRHIESQEFFSGLKEIKVEITQAEADVRFH